MKKITILSVVIAITLFIACRQPVQLKVEPDELQFFSKGESKSLKVTAFDKKGKAIEKVKILYSSSNPAVATVDESGKVTAAKTGSATIEVKLKELIASVSVKVVIPDIFKIDFPTPGVFEASGPEKSIFTPLITAKDEIGKDIDLSLIKFSSSKPEIATINEKGEITLLTDGTTTITMSLGSKNASLELPVTILRPSAIKIDSPRFSIGVGESAYLPFTVISSKGTPLIHFPVTVEFDQSGIATSNEYGEVTGVAPGTTKVTIKAQDSTNSLVLTVKK